MFNQVPKPGFVMKASDLAACRIELFRVCWCLVVAFVTGFARQVVCSHEHFIALNLPVLRAPAETLLAIEPLHIQSHFLIGLLLAELKQQAKK